MPVMGLMAPNETALAKNLLNQVRIGPRERPVNTGDYLQQWLPASGLKACPGHGRKRKGLAAPDVGNHCRM